MTKQQKVYTMARRVRYHEFVDVVASSEAEAKRTLNATRESPKERTKWMVLGHPKPVAEQK